MNPEQDPGNTGTGDLIARAALSFLAEPGEPALGTLLRCCEPAEIVAAIRSAREPRAVLPAAARGVPGLARAFARWRARAGQIRRRPAWRRGAGTACAWWARATRSGRPSWMSWATSGR